MTPCCHGVALLLGILAMTGCSREPSLTISQIEGEYVNSPCPPITIKGNIIGVGNEFHSFDLINIKGDNILHTRLSPFFVEREGRCNVVFRPSERYIFLRQEGGVSLEILSESLILSRNFRKR